MGDRLATSTAASGFAWIVPDLHGNVVAQCALDGTLTDVFRYDAYGNAIGNTQGTTAALSGRLCVNRFGTIPCTRPLAEVGRVAA